MEYRLVGHSHLLNAGKHNNRTMQADWDRYGQSAFSARILEEGDFTQGELWAKEGEYIVKMGTFTANGGYNLSNTSHGSIRPNHRRTTLTIQQAKRAKKMYAAGIFPKEIAEKLGCEAGSILTISSLGSWKWLLPELNEKITQIRKARGMDRSLVRRVPLEHVRKMETAILSGKRQLQDIAKQFNVSPSYLSRVRNAMRERGLEQRIDGRTGHNNPHSKLTAAEVMEIRRLLRAGAGPNEIGKRFGVKGSSIVAIRDGVSWKWLH